MKQTNTKNFKGSRQSIWPYIKLQLALSLKSDKTSKKAKIVVSWILKVLVLVIVCLFLYLFVARLTSQTKKITGQTVSIAFFTLFQIGLLVYSISAQIRRLHRPSDLRIIATLPYTSFQRYLGEIIAIYLRLTIYTVAIFYPICLAFGIGGHIINVAFAFSSLLATLVLPLLPFALSLVICVPFMYLTKWLSDKNIIRLIIFIILFAGFLILYAFVLNIIADGYIHAKYDAEIINNIVNFLTNLNKPYNPAYFVSEVCLANKIYVNLPIMLTICIGLIAIGIAITKPLYDKFTSQGIIESDATVRNSKITSNQPYKAIFLKEIKQMLRTPTYAYFYLGVAVTMPILTYLISDVVIKLGEAQIGSNLFFGFALLIVTLIISLVGAYSANAISREGTQFYITKVSPLSYRKQLLTKALVNFSVAFIGLLLCILVLGCTCMGGTSTMPGLSGSGLGFIFGISTFFLIGMTFNGINIDLGRPKIDMLSSRINDSNILIQLIINLAITAIVSLVAITFGAINQQITLYVQLSILGFMILYALINFLIWFYTCEKRYHHIELK